MEIKVLQEELQKAISICSRFASTRVQLPVLANICLTAEKAKLKVAATNLEFSVAISLGAKVEKEGSITVPSKIISDLIGNLKRGQIDLKSEKEILEISSAEFSSKIAGINATDFPSVPDEIGAGSIKIPFSTFLAAVGKVLFSVSSDETRPVLTGVLVILKNEEILIVSTDGFRLSHAKLKISGLGDEEKRFIVPKGILSEIARVGESGEVEFLHKKSDNQVVFGSGHIVMSSRVIEGEFPDFEKIIPKDTRIKLNLDKEELLRNIKLASVFARDASNVIKLSITKEGVEITSESQQYGSQEAKVAAKVQGVSAEDKFVIAFNYRFIEEFLQVCKSDDVQIEFSDPSAPSLFLDTKDTNFFHIIMPVRLQN